ncbi:nucleotidyltransferase domain-containing protein [Janibacter anophelis]|uniref:nucleotidyltransferase domain-containing protein n=1 Tax=Janibacter anophelis TaxID=319054 RepID=UPI000A0327E8|nr:nucleotidyltransferase domain-containing protein [Janibacter anophelis]
MDLVQTYRDARRDELLAKTRRGIALRAMAASGLSQREIAELLGVSQPAISQQMASAPKTDTLHPEDLLAAASPALTTLAELHGYRDLAVFGSVARHEARPDSDIDLLVRPPAGTSTFDFIRFKHLLETVLGRDIDLVELGGLTPGMDDDIRRDAVPL